MQVNHFSTADALNQDFAVKLQSLLSNAVAERGQAYLVVSGGKTPQALFNTLASSDLPWSKITVLLADDRWLPSSHADSNEGLVKNSLLKNNATAACFISLYSEQADSAFDGAAEINKRLADLPAFDAVILGMGEDGHTASLFPCSEQLTAGLDDNAPAALAVKPTTAPYERLSLSKQRILNSRQIFLHLVGDKKLHVLNNAIADTDITKMPIRAFLHHPQTDVCVMYAPK